MNLGSFFTCEAGRAALMLGLVPGQAGSPGMATTQARVVLADTAFVANPCAQLLMQAEAELADCGCPPKACVRTQGYWSNKPGVLWPSGFDRDAPFIDCFPPAACSSQVGTAVRLYTRIARMSRVT